MIKVAVLDDYQNAFQQIVEVEKYKDKFDFKVFNEPFVDEKEAIVEVNEPDMYRKGGENSFLADAYAARQGDYKAQERINKRSFILW